MTADLGLVVLLFLIAVVAFTIGYFTGKSVGEMDAGIKHLERNIARADEEAKEGYYKIFLEE